MENEKSICKDCSLPQRIEDLESRMLNHSSRIEKIFNAYEVIKEGLHGDFKNNGLVARVTTLEQNFQQIVTGLKEAKDLAKKSFSFLMAIAIAIIGGVGVLILSTFLK